MGVRIPQGSVGVLIEFDIKEVLQNPTSVMLLYKKPDWSIGKWDGSISGTKVQHVVTVENELDLIGGWKLQVRVTDDRGVGISTIDTFRVTERIGA